jgi:hypothetical protein
LKRPMVHLQMSVSIRPIELCQEANYVYIIAPLTMIFHGSFLIDYSNVYTFDNMVWNSHHVVVQSNRIYKYKVKLPRQAHTAPPLRLYGTVKSMVESDGRRINIYLKETIRNDSKRFETILYESSEHKFLVVDVALNSFL